MNRIDKVFKKLKTVGRKAFIPYVACGDPDINFTKQLVIALAGAGADIIEIGIPFSDPLADGPTIQKASERAIVSGVTIEKIFKMTGELRRVIDTPLVYMTYYNIIFNYGVADFARESARSGADAVIVPDLPFEESGELSFAAAKEGLYTIQFAAPTTSADRFKMIAPRAKGFIYYVSLTGVTGARNGVPKDISGKVNALRKLSRIPVCVGFGVSTPEQAKKISKFSDGVIVGSALINAIQAAYPDRKKMLKEASLLARGIAVAVHGER